MYRTYYSTFNETRGTRRYIKREKIKMNRTHRTKVRKFCCNPLKLLNELFPSRNYRKYEYSC